MDESILVKELPKVVKCMSMSKSMSVSMSVHVQGA